MTLATYNEYSNTIRKEPENYCLISWNNKESKSPKFDVDSATIPYRIFVESAYKEWVSGNVNDKNLLAKMVSDSIEKNYKPFSSYPKYNSSDVFNSLKMIKSEKKYELESEYRDCDLELWEAQKSNDEQLIEQIIKNRDKIVHEIYELYNSQK